MLIVQYHTRCVLQLLMSLLIYTTSVIFKYKPRGRLPRRRLETKWSLREAHPKRVGAFLPKCGFPLRGKPQNKNKEKKATMQVKRPLRGQQAAAVLDEHAIYNYSGPHCKISYHTRRLSGPAPSCQRRRELLSSFFYNTKWL